MIDHDPARQATLEYLDVASLGRAVDDDIEMIAAAGCHQVVDDPAGIVEQHRVAQAAILEQHQLARQQRLERLVDPRAADDQLAHVADVEQAGMGAGPQMLGDDAVILDRHGIARERDHPRAMGTVPRVERQHGRFGDDGSGLIVHGANSKGPRATPARCLENSDPRLSLRPESFPRGDAPSYPFGGPHRWGEDTFQTVRPARSWCLRDSGGGCSFGVRGLHPQLSRAAFRRERR